MVCAFSLAGTSVIAARFMSDKLGVFTITAASLFFSLLLLVPLCWKRLAESVRTLSLTDWRPIIFQGFFGIFLFRMFLLYGLEYTSSGEAGIITGATPAFTVFLAVFLLKEKVNRTAVIGIVSTVAGILLIQKVPYLGTLSAFATEHFKGNLMVLAAAICESLFNISSRRAAVKATVLQRKQVHPMVQTTLVAAAAWLLCLVPAQFEDPVTSLAAIGWVEWTALVWYGPIVTALAFMAVFAGIKLCSASTAAAVSGMMPFTALLLSVFVLGEKAGWQQWFGGALVILGMALIGRQKQAQEKTHRYWNKKKEALP